MIGPPCQKEPLGLVDAGSKGQGRSLFDEGTGSEPRNFVNFPARTGAHKSQENYAFDRGGEPVRGAGGTPPGNALALGNNADFVAVGEGSTSYVTRILPPPSTALAWMLRSNGREILKENGVARRMRWCGSKISKRSRGVDVYQRPGLAYGRLGGVCVCGQSLCCPVCAPRISAFRAPEVADCYAIVTGQGYEAHLETFTMPHHQGESLETVHGDFTSAWTRFVHSRSSAVRRAGKFGDHTGREINWSSQNGWHYHHHVCRYDKVGTYDAERTKADWLGSLDSVGRATNGVEKHAFDSGLIGKPEHARYVAKLATATDAQARSIGSELASASTKGRNFNTLLRAAVYDHDERAAAAWLEGVIFVTTRKISSVRWSPGLREKVGMGPEKAESAIAAESITPQDVLLGSLRPFQWSGVLKFHAEFALVCAANQGLESVNNFLRGLELGDLHADLDEFEKPSGPWV